MDAVDPRENVIDIIAIAENPSGQDIAILNPDTIPTALNYVPPIYQLIGQDTDNNFRKVVTNSDGSILGNN